MSMAPLNPSNIFVLDFEHTHQESVRPREADVSGGVFEHLEHELWLGEMRNTPPWQRLPRSHLEVTLPRLGA